MARISAGSYDLNKWLHGGYDSDSITVIYGDSASGKTNFCLLAAVSQAKRGKKVVYMDSEGGFSVERVKQIVEGQNSKIELNEVLENIFLLKPTNFDEQKKDFQKLLQFLKQEVGLIIIDSLTILYRLEFASAKEENIGEVQKVNSELTRQMRILAEIARKREIPIIVTNQVYKWDNNQKMVGGDIVRYWAKCWIELLNENGKRTAVLRKHRSIGEKSLPFYILDEGVKKRGWI